jgi:hypothetical protein
MRLRSPLIAATPRAALCYLKAVVGQRDIDHSKTPIPYRLTERTKRFVVRRASEPEVAAAGAADFVRDAMAARLGADLTVLGRDDVCSDRSPKLLQTLPVGFERLQPSRGVIPCQRRASSFGLAPQTAD